jgi:hypothetical protein
VPTVTFYSANASDYFRAHPRSAIRRPLAGGRVSERALFPGVTPALTAVALVPPLGAVRIAYLAGLLVSFDLSRGFTVRSTTISATGCRSAACACGARERHPGDQPGGAVCLRCPSPAGACRSARRAIALRGA